MKSFVKILVMLVVVALVVVFGSPYYKLYTLKNAYEQGDHVSIVNAINTETLRPNLKAQIAPKIDRLLAQNQSILALAQNFGVNTANLGNFAKQFADNAIDQAITHDNLTALAKGEIHQESLPLLAGVALSSGLIDTNQLMLDYVATGDLNQALARQKAQIAKNALAQDYRPSQPKLSYCGLNCFDIQTTLKDTPITLVMHRKGLIDWQIENIILP